MDRKKNIYYARTYRRIQINVVKSVLLACILIIPSVVLLILMMDDLTGMLSDIGVRILSGVIPMESVRTATTEYSAFNTIEYIELPTTYPDFSFICYNLAVCVLLLIIMLIGIRTGSPLAIFMLFGTIIHIVSCIFFLLAADKFPYTLGTYSDIYLKQQLGIWLIFIILGGLVIAFIGERGYFFKLVTFLSIISYSVVFGSVRYIIFMFILYRFSVLYMALLFFVLGPMYDFAYFVAIYAIYVNKNIKDYKYGKNRGVWKWS